MKILIEVEVKDMDEHTQLNDYIKFHNKIYKFKGYDYDSIWLEDLETGEEKQFDWY